MRCGPSRSSRSGHRSAKVKSRGVVSFRLLPEGGGQAVRESSGRAGSVCSLRVRMRLRMEMSEK